jgi:hypothetical protein
MQKHFRTLKQFQSPLVGSKIKGDLFTYGEESAQEWVKLGLIEVVSIETKPQHTKKANKKAK